MKTNKPIIKILRKVKIGDTKSALDVVIEFLYNVKKMSVDDIAAILEIGVGSVYNALKNKSL